MTGAAVVLLLCCLAVGSRLDTGSPDPPPVEASPGPSAGDPRPGPLTIELLQARYLNTVLAYVLQRVKNQQDAEDITAETFEAAWSALPGFRGECRPDAWLLAIARRKITLAERRSRRSRRTVKPRSELSEREQKLLDLLLVVDPRQLPPDRLLQDEARGVMRALLDSLPESQRTALTLQHYHGFSIRDVAAVLNRSPAAANSLLERARATILRLGKAYFLG